MIKTKNIVVYAILTAALSLQAGCRFNDIKDTPQSCTNSLNYYDEGQTAANDKPPTKQDKAVKEIPDACIKLSEAIRLSMPGGKQQDDEKALLILKDLKHSATLSGSDQQFNNMLLQHISQRQSLRELINTQKISLKKIETQNAILRNQLKTIQSQLDQLKNIEVEIDKKERSVISPMSE
ncbi:MAG: hypothetical protein IMF15_10580 [Proteobacteria bacterium]|nr:hypothetical protein [Pseudomonadota bacterium]